MLSRKVCLNIEENSGKLGGNSLKNWPSSSPFPLTCPWRSELLCRSMRGIWSTGGASCTSKVKESGMTSAKRGQLSGCSSHAVLLLHGMHEAAAASNPQQSFILKGRRKFILTDGASFLCFSSCSSSDWWVYTCCQKKPIQHWAVV